jgi:glutamate dehydrogenase
VLAANSPITAKLVRYFELRFDPDVPQDEAAEQALRDEILADLEEVSSIDHDRILRNQLGAVDATLRTNAYKPGRGATSFKLRSPDVPAIPQPPPAVEVYVYAADVEGIHLRGGPIARGGIRFSDRMDYRTEVYGLMRAQLTKNAVIVPAGAKGGFIVKRSPIDKAAIEESYVTYIRSLLDVTDNLVDGQVVHPEGVRVRDDDDTYLSWPPTRARRRSRHRQRISAEYGFWLDDAFASGGSSAMTTISSGSPRVAPGSRSSATSASSRGCVEGRVSRPSASATCPATSSATGCCSPSTSGSWPPTTTGTSSSTPTRAPPPASPSASACSKCRAPPGTTTTAS